MTFRSFAVIASEYLAVGAAYADSERTNGNAAFVAGSFIELLQRGGVGCSWSNS
jgi:hypothetical protein